MITDTPCPCDRDGCQLTADDPRHGTPGDNGYKNLGCGCRPCRDAHAAWHRKHRAENKAYYKQYAARRYQQQKASA